LFPLLSIAIDLGGNKWLGTNGGGLAKFNDTTWTVYNVMYSSLPNNNITSIAIDASGTKWIATWGGGLVKFDGTNWAVYNSSNSGLPYDWVQSIAIDNNGNKWIGTSYGLAVFSGNSAIKIPPKTARYSLIPLCRNYPNPFKQKTILSYNVLENGLVCLRIYSLDGQVVQTLVNARQTIGSYTVTWDGTNDKSRIMARGVYMYKLMNGGRAISGKMNFVE
jgi:hypothetical protein